MSPTLEQIRDAFYADLLSLPFHRHLGIGIERAGSELPRVSLPPKPEISVDGQHSPAAVFTLGEAACAVQMCDAVAPRAVELEMGVIFLTVGAEWRSHGPAHGEISASTSLVEGLEQGKVKKATIVTAARITGEDGALAAEQQVSFYVRFMDEQRASALAPGMELSRLAGS